MVENQFVYLITELLGPSLEDLFNLCGRKFSLKTCLMLFYQILERLELMHKKGYIHRDIKPDNMMMGMRDKSPILHMIDFGLTRSVFNKKAKKHIEFRTGKNLVGTARFVSINAHLGYELSRRDDLISVGYVMVYFMMGQLPWHHVDTRRKSARFTELGRMKQSYSPAQLCSACPVQYRLFFEYCNSLSFEAMPDYSYLKGLIIEAAMATQLRLDDRQFDWCAKLLVSPNFSQSNNKQQLNQHQAGYTDDNAVSPLRHGISPARQMNKVRLPSLCVPPAPTQRH